MSESFDPSSGRKAGDWHDGSSETDEALAQAARFANILTEAQARQVAQEAAKAEWRRQDSDFCAMRINLSFMVTAPDGEIYESMANSGLGEWDAGEDDAKEAFLNGPAIPEIQALLEAWTTHYAQMGLMRRDWEGYPSIFLLYRSARDMPDAARLATLPAIALPLSKFGMVLNISADSDPVNATKLHEMLCDVEIADPGVIGWTGSQTPDLLPQEGEGRDEWCNRVALSGEQVSRLVDRWEASGRDIEIFASYGGLSERARGGEKIDWLVDGVLARNAITMLVGGSSAGKSTTAHGWLAALCGETIAQPRMVLDREITGRFHGALIAGEDPIGVINYRAGKHASIWGDQPRSVVFDDADQPLDHYLQKLSAMSKMDFLIIDPIRVFFKGNEKEAGDVEAFFAPILHFARKMNCAVLVIHHLTKVGEEAKSTAALAQFIRGSAVFKQYVRMNIGLARRHEGTVEVSPLKHNYPGEEVWIPQGQSQQYWPNPATFTLDPLPAGKIAAPTGEGPVAPHRAQVLAAVDRCNRTGAIVRKSGKSGLFECRLPELAGISRAALLETITALVASGELIDGEGGLAVPAQPR